MSEDAALIFDPLRPLLVRVAYRMLGSVADAEDAVQDAFVRWLRTPRDEVHEPEAFLRRIVMRLCLDRLKAARRSRETYIGPWLPEPVVVDAGKEVDTVTLPLLMALERLSPLERAAFLLHDVFGLGFEEVAATIGREAAACRQLASRARTHVRADRPRYPVPRRHGFAIAEAFLAASRDGDTERLRSLLAADVMLYADGGGKAPANREPLVGLASVLQFFARFAPVFAENPSRLMQYGMVNGLPGFITMERGDILQTTALEIDRARIQAIYVVRNPDKLTHVGKAVH